MPRGLLRALALLCCVACVSTPASAIQLQGRLTSLVYTQERFDVGGEENQIPFFQFIHLNTYDPSNKSLSFHLDAYGKADLADETDGHHVDGELTYGYLQWYDRVNNIFLRAGRTFVRSGIASEYLDGVYGDWHTPYHVGFQGFAGKPVNFDSGGRSGDWEWGGRVYSRYERLELGLSGMEARDDDQLAFSRMGGDLWAQVLETVTVNAHGFWDRVSEEWFDYQLLVSWDVTEDILLSVDYGQVIPNLFLSHTSIFGNQIFSDGEQRELGIRADYHVTRNIHLAAYGRRYDYSEGDDDWIAGAEARYRWGKGLRNMVGGTYEFEDDGQETHLFGRYTLDCPRLKGRPDLARLYYGLDLVLYHFDEPIFPNNRQHYTYSTIGTFGADIGDHWEVTFTLDYGTRPEYRDVLPVAGARVPDSRELDLAYRNDLDASVKVVYKFF